MTINHETSPNATRSSILACIQQSQELHHIAARRCNHTNPWISRRRTRYGFLAVATLNLRHPTDLIQQFMRESSRIARPPSTTRLPSPSKALNEISESESNTRAKIPVSKMPPPSTASKHRMGSCKSAQIFAMETANGHGADGDIADTEPEPKRKTLAERAGEPASSQLPRSLPQPSTVSGVQATSLAKAKVSSYNSIRNPSSIRTLSPVLQELVKYTRGGSTLISGPLSI